MSDRTGLSRGDRNRNARLARLRVLVPPENAIVGVDLASRSSLRTSRTSPDCNVLRHRGSLVRSAFFPLTFSL